MKKEETKETKVENSKEGTKLTYEQLTEAYNNLYEKANQMFRQLQEAKFLLSDQRLKYLFEVLKYSDKFDLEFVGKCTDEIKESLTIEEEETTNGD